MSTFASPSPAPQPSPPQTFMSLVGRNYTQEEVEFLVPDLERDKEMGVYLTLALARLSTRPEVRAWYDTARGFYELARVETEAWLAGDQLAGRRLRSMFRIGEQFEVRLGYVRNGHDGNAVGDGELLDLLTGLMRSWPAFREALPTHPDTLNLAPLFGMDRVSDVTVAIGKRHVIEFTQWCAEFYGFARSAMDLCTVHGVWNGTSFSSVDRVLPVDANGRPILLVWKGMVRSSAALRADQYFDDLYGSDYKGSRTKRHLMTDAASHPGRLTEFAGERLRDAKRIAPRRDLFPRPIKRIHGS